MLLASQFQNNVFTTRNAIQLLKVKESTLSHYIRVLSIDPRESVDSPLCAGVYLSFWPARRITTRWPCLSAAEGLPNEFESVPHVCEVRPKKNRRSLGVV